MATYQTIVLMNLSKWENPKKLGTGFTMDVVMSVQDGVRKDVGVEKAYFKDDGNGGVKRMPKLLNRKDFKLCAENWPKILDLMENPPPVPEVQAAPSQTIDSGVFGG